MIWPRLLLLSLLASALLMGSPAWGRQCWNCHDREALLGGSHQHPPAREENCGACHNPHATAQQGLLHKPQKQLCSDCHGEAVAAWEQAKFSHKPVVSGRCSQCHSPHTGDHPGLLRQPPRQLCGQCHNSVTQSQDQLHQPFAQGRCQRCHNPHGADSPALLRQKPNAICRQCHQANSAWQQKHLGYAADGMACLECHHPHMSNQPQLLRPNQHQPFKAGNCGTCHSGGQAQGNCLNCHQQVMGSFQKAHSHLQAGGENACTACHSPHTSSQKGLLKGLNGAVCRNCHSHKFQQRQQALHLHPDANNCSNCHVGHGSNQPAMLRPDACDSCHGEHSTFTHPLGEAARDPRTGNPMDCISCHAPCTGTLFEYNLLGGKEKGLCLPCHPGY